MAPPLVLTSASSMKATRPIAFVGGGMHVTSSARSRVSMSCDSGDGSSSHCRDATLRCHAEQEQSKKKHNVMHSFILLFWNGQCDIEIELVYLLTVYILNHR